MSEPAHDWTKQYEQPSVVPQPLPRSRKSWLGVSISGALVLVLAWVVVPWATETPEPAIPPAPRKTIDLSGLQLPTAVAISADPRTFTVTAPAKLGGRVKSTDAELVKLAGQIDAQRSQQIAGASAASAYYGSHSRKNLVFLTAVASKSGGMDRRLVSELGALIANPNNVVVTALASADAGQLGGIARCGELKIHGLQVSVCGWADGQTMGVIGFYYTDLSKAKVEFLTLRGEVEQVTGGTP